MARSPYYYRDVIKCILHGKASRFDKLVADAELTLEAARIAEGRGTLSAHTKKTLSTLSANLEFVKAHFAKLEGRGVGSAIAGGKSEADSSDRLA